MAQKVFNFILSASTRGWNSVNTAQRGLNAFNRELKVGNQLMESAKGQIAGLVGAYLGFNALAGTANIVKIADTAIFGLEASLKAANREFKNTGSVQEWEARIDSLSKKLRIYSKTELRTAVASTVDMTKRLGFSADQMEKLIALTADLSAGRTDLAGGIERVTAAMRGEAEASEYLGLTLNETYVKTWYEARGAMQGAWKDLTDLEKAQVRYQVFLEQAVPLQNKAADSIKTMSGALSLVRSRFHDAVSENEDLIAVTRELAEYLAANADEIGAMATAMLDGAISVTKWVVENRELVATIGKLALGLWAVSKAAGAVHTIFRAISAASLAMTGTSLVGWLVKVRGLLNVIQLTGGAAFAGIFGVVGLAVYDIIAIKQLIAQYRELKQIKEEIREQEIANAKAADELAAKYREISAATGITIKSMEELDKAVEEGKIHFDESTATWVAGSKKMAGSVGEVTEAVKESFGEQEKISDEKLKEMEAAYKRYVEKVKSLNSQIAAAEKSLAAELREMARSGMSGISAWRDRKKEADEYYRAAERSLEMAQEALKKGDEETAGFRFKEAKEYADSAKDAYRDLNTEVKDGDQVLVSQQQGLKKAMAGVEDSGRLAIRILGEQKEAARAAAEELNKQTGGKLGTDHLKELNGLTVDYQKEIKKATQHWETQWETVEKDGKRVLETIAGEIDKLSGKTIDVYVKRIEAKAAGGLAGIPGLAEGGAPWMYFPRYSSPHITSGAGGVDDVPTLLMRNEYVQPVAAVKKYGLRFMEMIRRGLFPVELARGFASGGTPAGSVALGSAAGSGSAGLVIQSLEFNFHGQSPPNPRQFAKQFVNELRTVYGGSS